MLNLDTVNQEHETSALSLAIISVFDILRTKIEDLDECINDVTNHVLKSILNYKDTVNKSLFLEVEKKAYQAKKSIEEYIHIQVEDEIDNLISYAMIEEVIINRKEKRQITIAELKRDFL